MQRLTRNRRPTTPLLRESCIDGKLSDPVSVPDEPVKCRDYAFLKKSSQRKLQKRWEVLGSGNWHRIGFTWDGSHRRLYVDDVLVAEDTDVALAGCHGGLNIGCGKGAAPDSFFTGLIDDVRGYNRAVKP